VLGLAIAACLALQGCAASPTPPPRAPQVARHAESLPFHHDDFAGALAEAKRTHRPLFVDAWATWCHSCQSMRAYVLTDPSLAPLADRFVWLAVDTDKDDNADFTRRFPNRVWPTLWVVDPETGAPTMKWEGTATAPELVSLLGTVGSGAGGAFQEATLALARGDRAAAERGYKVAMASSTADRPRAVEALVGLLGVRKDHAACAELAVAQHASLPPGTSRAVVLASGLSCARDAKLPAAVTALSEAAERVAGEADPRTAVDDRSALYEELVETRQESGDVAGARALARTWASMLEEEAARAPSSQARAVFDAHRLSAYLAAEEPDRALEMLAHSERDFPSDYNPPARLARAYLAAHRLEEARAAVERAAARVYGPRSLRVFALAADVAEARGDRVAERAALEAALARTERAVLNEGQAKLRADLAARLEKVRARP